MVIFRWFAPSSRSSAPEGYWLSDAVVETAMQLAGESPVSNESALHGPCGPDLPRHICPQGWLRSERPGRSRPGCPWARTDGTADDWLAGRVGDNSARHRGWSGPRCLVLLAHGATGPPIPASARPSRDGSAAKGNAEPPVAMIGPPPSARGLTGRPTDLALHAEVLAHEWADVGESYCRKRMRELGVPEDKIGVRRRELNYRAPLSYPASGMAEASHPMGSTWTAAC